MSSKYSYSLLILPLLIDLILARHKQSLQAYLSFQFKQAFIFKSMPQLHRFCALAAFLPLEIMLALNRLCRRVVAFGRLKA